MQVTLVVKLPATVKKKGRFFISCCPLLDVYSQGETEGKALRNLKEALRLFLISCFERGTLDEVLKTCGFKPAEKRMTKIEPFPKKYKSVRVPLPFTAPQKVDRVLCHA